MAAGTVIAPLQTSNGINANVTLLLALTAGNLAITTVSRIRPTVRLSNMNGAAATVTVKIINVTDTTTIYRESVAKDVAANTSMTFVLPSFLTLANKTYSISVLSSNASDIVVSWQIDWEDVGIAAANLTQWLGTAPLALAAQRVPADATAISGDSTAADNLEAAFDGTGYSFLYQQAAREAHGVSGTVWHVAYNAGETMGNDALSWATADLTAGVGVKTDIEAATAGDAVHIGAGTFALGANQIATPASVCVRGSGADVTTITGTTAGSMTWTFADNSEISDLTIDTSAVSNGRSLGLNAADAVAVHVVLRNVVLRGDYDALLVAPSAGACSVSAYDCVFESAYDTVVSFNAAHTLYLYNCVINARGPSISGTTPVSGVRCSQGTIWLWNCDVNSQDGAAGQTTDGLLAGTTGNIIMVGGRIRTYNAAGTDLAVRNTGSGRIVLIGVDYDRTKTSNTGAGTISDIARVVTDTSGNAYADVKLVKTVDADTAVQADANAALVANNLDHLALTAASIPAIPAGTYIDQMMDDGTATFDRTTDSLQAIRDRGDSAWPTATGFATPTNITAGTITTVTNLTNAPTAGDLTGTMKTSVATAVDASTLATDLNNLRDMSLNAVTAGTVNDAAATTLSFVTNLTEATNDHYKNRILEFTSGALAGQGREIEAYDGATKTITLYEALTDAPANGVTFKILGYIAP